jgi:hypothetical protein
MPEDDTLEVGGVGSVRQPPQREKQMLLDMHLMRAAQEGDADRSCPPAEVAGQSCCSASREFTIR